MSVWCSSEEVSEEDLGLLGDLGDSNLRYGAIQASTPDHMVHLISLHNELPSWALDVMPRKAS